MEKRISIRELVASISVEYEVLGNLERYITKPSPIDQAEEESLSFYANEKEHAVRVVRNSKAGVIVCSKEIKFSETDYCGKTIIKVTNPRLVYVRLLQKHFSKAVGSGVHPTAIIDSDAKIGSNVSIGPYCFIGKCEICEDTVIRGNVQIYDKVKIGKNVIIHAGTVIGDDSLGFVKNEKGEWEKFPQFGGVVIGQNVEIGSNVSIDRGTLSDTIIGEGTKIENNIQIAHNCQIGKHCAIVSEVYIGGSAKIGDYTWISPQVCIRNWVSVGSNVLVGMGSVVTKDIGDNLVVMGVPARKIRENIPS